MNDEANGTDRPSWLRVLVADDHALLREGLKLVLSQPAIEQHLRVVAEAGNAEGVLAELADKAIDLLVLDLGMPGVTGSRWVRSLRESYPDLRIIIMTGNQDTHTRDAVLATGVDAYLLKQGDSQALLEAALAVAANRQRSNPASPSKEPLPPSDRVSAPAESLTRREQQILALIAAGATGPEVAERLFISPLTVRKHRENLMRKLEVHTTAELVAYAMRLGLH